MKKINKQRKIQKNTRWLSGEFNRVAPPPAAPRDKSAFIYHGETIKDPFRPLEALDAPATQQWIEAQNKRLEKFLENSPVRTQAAEEIRSLMSFPYEGIPARYGEKYFRWTQKKDSALYNYEVKDNPLEPWRTLLTSENLDPVQVGGKEGDNIALFDAVTRADGRFVIYSISLNGSDKFSLRVRNVVTGEDLEDQVDNLRYCSPRWRQDGQSFAYVRFDNPAQRSIYVHKLGDKAEDVLIFTAPENEAPGYFRLGGQEWVACWPGTLPLNGLWRLDEKGQAREIFKSGIAQYSLLTKAGDRFWMKTDHDAPRGQIVSFDPEQPDKENWKLIIPESESLIQDAACVEDKLLVHYTESASDRLAIYDREGTYLYDVDFPPLSRISLYTKGGAVFLTVNGPADSESLYSYDVVENRLHCVRGGLAPVNLRDCIVETLYAPSKDGTEIPVQVIRRPDVALDGSAALQLYGYGGFNISMNLQYNAFMAYWVRNGGIYAVAQLRGGGEFGRDWYDGGRLLNKQNCFDDFAGAAKMLVARNYTSPARLVIRGGSNGGLLTLATMLQNPRLFGAVISEVPVADMLRYDQFPDAGKGWRSDYGDPQGNVEDFQAARAYSPLHNVRPGAYYPPCLVVTGDHDDRVVPAHSYKFIAALQKSGYRDNITLLRVGRNIGHGANTPQEEQVAAYADMMGFIERAIGPLPQAEYKAARAQRRERDARRLDL